MLATPPPKKPKQKACPCAGADGKRDFIFSFHKSNIPAILSISVRAVDQLEATACAYLVADAFSEKALGGTLRG